MNNLEITIKSVWDYTTIYINGILHIQLPNDLKIATETWRDTHNSFTKYCIQFVNAETGKIILICEYDIESTWITILKLWDENNKKARP